VTLMLWTVKAHSLGLKFEIFVQTREVIDTGTAHA
jgi:hypothetical protein